MSIELDAKTCNNPTHSPTLRSPRYPYPHTLPTKHPLLIATHFQSNLLLLTPTHYQSNIHYVSPAILTPTANQSNIHSLPPHISNQTSIPIITINLHHPRQALLTANQTFCNLITLSIRGTAITLYLSPLPITN